MQPGGEPVLIHVIVDLVGTGIIGAVLKHVGMIAWFRELRKICQNWGRLVHTFPDHPPRYVVKCCCYLWIPYHMSMVFVGSWKNLDIAYLRYIVSSMLWHAFFFVKYCSFLIF